MPDDSTGSELRDTGIGVVGAVPWGTHFCHFYETKADLLDISLPYFKAGLESNELCVWVVFDPLNEKEATDALRRAIPGADQHLAAGRIEIVSSTEWYLTDGVFDLPRTVKGWEEKLAQALGKGYAGLRINGNEAWLTEDGWKQFCEYEKVLHKLIANQRILVMCTYPLAVAKATELFDIARTHQFAIAKRNGRWEVLETPELAQAKAEIERLNGCLEKRIVERTRELEVRNEELGREIIERQRAEALRQESERQYEALVQSIDGIVCEADGQTLQITFINKAAEKILGYSSEQWLSDHRSWINRLHPEDRDWVIEAKLQVAARGQGDKLEYRMIAADGRVVWLRDVITVSMTRGNAVLLRSVKVDITDQKRIEEERERLLDQVRVTRKQLQRLSRQLMEAQEAERRQIARELHDEIGQALTAAKINLQSMADGIDTALSPQLSETVEILDRLLQQVRQISLDLRPSLLDDLGLVPALRSMLDQQAQRAGLEMRFSAAALPENINEEIQTTFFRIVQEALTNILRHARARSVAVELRVEDAQLRLKIIDDGVGFDPDAVEERTGKNFGLLGIKERAVLAGGSARIVSAPGEGTTIEVILPLQP